MTLSRIKALKSYPKTFQHLKFDLKWIFWSLAVHRYQKQCSFMTIFATRGEGMKLVIDGNFIARKMKNQKFWGKLMLGSSKKKQRTCRFQIHVGKVWIFEKNQFFEFFSIFAKGGTLWCQNSKFSFFNILIFATSFFQK